MKNKASHLYIHIPFCKAICTYCDFFRFTPKNLKVVDEYIDKIVLEINKITHKLKSIYVGGGTPNYLSNQNLEKLLVSLKKNISQDTEVTFECNPELITDDQVFLFKKYKVNRISLGVQTLNEKILKLLNRQHKNQQVYEAIKKLNSNGISNISCDFIYNLPLMKKNDIEEIVNFLVDYKIQHLSWYALELKENSVLTLQKWKLDLNKESEFFDLINKRLKAKGFIRYEISNWVLAEEKSSVHNLAYWDMNDWIGIGTSAFGFENGQYYQVCEKNKEFTKKEFSWTEKDYFFYKLMMGLRKTKGIDLAIKDNMDAYLFFKDALGDDVEVKNNFLIAKKIDLLNDLLVKIL